MPPKKDQDKIDPKHQKYRAYPIPNPVGSSTDNELPQMKEYHGYDAFVKGQLGLDSQRLGHAMDVVTEQFKKEESFDGLFVATTAMKRMASLVAKTWCLNCYSDESSAKGKHVYYVCVGAIPNSDKEKSLLALSVMDAESPKNWKYFLSNLQKSFSSILEQAKSISFLTDGRPELVEALSEIMPNQRHLICINHARSKDLDPQAYIRSNEFCEQSCQSEVDNKSQPMVVAVFRTTERQRDVAIRHKLESGENRISENQFRMSMEVINENLNRRGVKPRPPSWASK